ncbi:MAG: pentapeptide repeat-containing protein, partial [Bacteroidia bacterium]
KDCKLIGVNFYECTDFLFCASFENCIMDYVSFAGKKMNKTIFLNCSLKEVNFSNSDLTGSSFKNCNLERSIFNRTQLKNVDFTSAFNFALDPEVNFIKKAKFSKDSLQGLLAKYDIIVE